MKKFIREYWSAILGTMIIAAMIGAVVVGVKLRYDEYLGEFNNAPESIELEIESIEIFEKNCRVKCSDGNTYYTNAIKFDPDVQAPTLLLEKIDQPYNVARFMIRMFDLGSATATGMTYRATIWMGTD